MLTDVSGDPVTSLFRVLVTPPTHKIRQDVTLPPDYTVSEPVNLTLVTI